MQTNIKSIEQAYKQRQSIIIIGLTGKTGSGCSTVANILKAETFKELNLHTPKDRDFINIEERKYAIVYKYMESKNHWKKFNVIHASSIIFSFVLEKGFSAIKDYLRGDQFNTDSNLDVALESIKTIFDEFEKKREYYNDLFGKGNVTNDQQKKIKLVCDEFPRWREFFEQKLKNITYIKKDKEGAEEAKFSLYVYLLQTFGNNIRCSGDPYLDNNSEEHFYDVAERINKVIGLLIENAKTFSSDNDQTVRICIDAIRNSYEAYYFKDQYSNFYLVSVNTEEEERRRRLNMYDQEELNSLDQIESAKDDPNIGNIFYHQNMSECLSISDIHLYNPRRNTTENHRFLSAQLIKYICLMLHPGIVAPTAEERCMQTAFVAKLNSGCLSRQVGAVITNQDYSVKAIGWNDVPKGQLPCNLRCVEQYANPCEEESFSDFERADSAMEMAFQQIYDEVSKQDLNGLRYSFCFKDIYNAITRKNNQIYTRALHAEENAFLQISKYGGSGIQGGILFSTASPCEMCSKKAFQLGIQDIYYIDPYPGISQAHILQFGTKYRPRIHLYHGAIGSAYVRLYSARIPLKDELELLTGQKPRTMIHGIRECVNG